MTVIFGANLIEEVLLASDCRSTLRTGAVSDTATKIVPIRPFLAVAVTGNPLQAAEIMSVMKKEIGNIEKTSQIPKLHGLSKDLVLGMMTAVADRVQPVSIKDSRCQLVFAGIDPSERQRITVAQVKQYVDSKNTGNGMLLPPQKGGANLVLYALQSKDDNEVIGLPYPSTYLVSFAWPSKEVKDIPCLEMSSWGSGGDYVESKIRPDFTALWQVMDGNTFFKRGILAITLKSLIQNKPEKGIGGLPQIVSVDISNGVSFQGYSNDSFEMIYEKDAWVQKNKKDGKVIKTPPSLVDFPSFDPSEIVNWLDDF